MEERTDHDWYPTHRSKRKHNEEHIEESKTMGMKRQCFNSSFSPSPMELVLNTYTATGRPMMVQILLVIGALDALSAVLQLDSTAALRPGQQPLFIPRRLLGGCRNFREAAMVQLRELGVGNALLLMSKMILLDPVITEAEKFRMVTFVVYGGKNAAMGTTRQESSVVLAPEALWNQVRADGRTAIRLARYTLSHQLNLPTE